MRSGCALSKTDLLKQHQQYEQPLGHDHVTTAYILKKKYCIHATKIWLHTRVNEGAKEIFGF